MGGDLAVPSYPSTHNVKDYGAVGNGAADDTAAFKAALADMTEGVLYVPQGAGRVRALCGGRRGLLYVPPAAGCV
eukprot:16610-Chlamydomonas_euryale.AAC.21